VTTATFAAKPSKKTSDLCWTARVVCLLPLATAPLSFLVAEATDPTVTAYAFPFNLVFAVFYGLWWLLWPGLILTLLALVARRSPLLGVTLLVISLALSLCFWWRTLPSVLFVPPAFLAWQRHLLGGTLLVSSSCLVIGYLCLDPVPFEWDRTWALHYILPVCTLFLLSGLLHLAVWWQERARRAT